MSKSEPQATLGAGTPEQQDDTEDEVDDNQASLAGAIDGQPPTPASSHTTPGEEESTESDGEMADGEGSIGDENLEEFGVDEDNRPNNPRLDNPDGNLEQDRRTNVRREDDNTTQEQLFPDVDDENQLTLGGDKAYNQCKFE